MRLVKTWASGVLGSARNLRGQNGQAVLKPDEGVTCTL